MNVDVKTFPDIRVACLRHVGPYSAVGPTWQRFAAWCGAHGLLERRPAMFGIAHDDPDATPPENCRYDTCAEVDAAWQPQGEVGVQTIAGGRYACSAFRGTAADVHAAWMRMFDAWLPASGWQADDRPCVEAYGSDMAVDPDTGVFGCELRLPVRARD